MIATLKSEIRKLLSIRSTYFIIVLALIIVAVFTFYVEGYWGQSGSPAGEANNLALREVVLNTASTVSIFASIVAIMFIVHEYRYNLITYTLTASNSRTKVLLSKIIVVSAFSILFTLFCIGFGLLAYRLGLSLRGVSLPAQNIDWLYVLERGLFYNLAQGLIGLLMGTLLRNITASIAFLFIVPATVEPLLGLLLKDNAVYLPFAALEKVIAIEGSPAFVSGELAIGTAALLVSGYLLAGWLATWQLFLRRDAN